ncbi:MAG: hypothetical protein HOP10_15015 [Chitinophagaceae bacterium]|nr:hypothetical protein [Chitinophagaceae bacterium]
MPALNTQQRRAAFWEDQQRRKWNPVAAPADYEHSSARFYISETHAAYPVLNYCELADINLTQPLENDTESTPHT